MLSVINRLLGAGQAHGTTDMLPPELQTIVCTATVMERNGEDENTPRILFMTARGSFYRDDKHPRRWLTDNWPELSEAQTLRAIKLIDARVLEVKRERMVRDDRPRWADWRPTRSTADWR